MFGSTTRSGASAYGNVGLETGVVSASPHKLIVMLFDGALAAVAKALFAMKAGNIPAKGKSISQAMLIIDNGLRASLDKESGGEIATNLDALYQYMGDRLLQANLQNKTEMLDEVSTLLKDLRGAWVAIGAAPAQAPQASPQAPMMQAARDPLAPASSRLVKA
jgi:flagellar protein FliS